MAREARRYDNVTFLMCLPRSRSAWLTQFLKPVAWTMHDPLKQCASIEELASKIDEVLFLNPGRPIFIADTAAVLFFGDVSRTFPDAKYLFVDRPLPEVAASLKDEGVDLPPEIGQRYESAFHRALLTSRARCDFRMEVAFDQIDRRLLNIWRFVGGDPIMSREYAERMCGTNIQIPFDQQRSLTDRRKVRRLFSTIGISITP
jgi:hypothetical protein